MFVSRFCDQLPDTGSSLGIAGLTLAIILTTAGAGFFFLARRGGLRTASMALLPLALLVPAGNQDDTRTNGDQPRTEQEECAQRPVYERETPQRRIS